MSDFLWSNARIREYVLQDDILAPEQMTHIMLKMASEYEGALLDQRNDMQAQIEQLRARIAELEQRLPPSIVLNILPRWAEIMLAISKDIRPHNVDGSVDLRREVQIVADWLSSLAQDSPAATGGE